MSSRCLIFEEYADCDTANLAPLIDRCREIRARIRLIVDSDALLSNKYEFIKSSLVEMITYCISIAQVMKCTVMVTLDDKAVLVTLSFSSVFTMEFAETLQFSIASEKAHGITIIPATNDLDQAMIILQYNISGYVKNDG